MKTMALFDRRGRIKGRDTRRTRSGRHVAGRARRLRMRYARLWSTAGAVASDSSREHRTAGNQADLSVGVHRALATLFGSPSVAAPPTTETTPDAEPLRRVAEERGTYATQDAPDRTPS